MDTDLLVALVLSSVQRADVSTEAALQALADADGDVDCAIATLSRGRKRQREAGLTRWLNIASGSNVPADTSESDIRVSAPRSPPPKKSQSSTALRNAQRPLARLPPLTLATPELVALHTPTTLHGLVLPQELACQLFYHLIREAETWSRNSWYLFDRMVTSPHRTAFFVRSCPVGMSSLQEMTNFWYNGKTIHSPTPFPPILEQTCRLIEPIVLREMKKRHRYPLEWAGDPMWMATVAAANCYDGMKEGVGYHADALTYLGPQCTIASLSLGCERRFRLRETLSPDPLRLPRTFDIPLPHNSLLIMHPPTQERFKHSIPPQTKLDVFRPPIPQSSRSETQAYNQRINVTFRFYRPDFCKSIPKCQCGVPAILRPDLKGLSAGKGKGDTEFRYFWQCDAGKVQEGRGCGMWQLLDWQAERRGPMRITSA